MTIQFKTIYKWMLPVVIMAFTVSCSGENNKTVEKEQNPVITAPTARVESFNPSHQWGYQGKVISSVRSRISTKIMGEIQYIPVNTGENVSEGTVLLQIKDDNLRAQKRQVEARLEEAKLHYNNMKKDFERYRVLYSDGSATQKEWDDVRTGFEAAESRVRVVESRMAELEDLLSYTRIKAPYDGLVAAKYAEKGDLASPGQPILVLEHGNELKYEFNIPESGAGSLRIGDTVKVHIPAAGLKELKAKVSLVGKVVQRNSRQIPAEAIPLNTDAQTLENLRSGMFAEFALPVSNVQTLVVDNKALVKRGQLTGLYILTRNNVTVLRWVRSGRNYGTYTEILSGVAEGERYVKDITGITREGLKINSENQTAEVQ